MEDLLSSGAEEERCRVIEERREAGAIAVIGWLMDARVRLTVGRRPVWIFLAENRVKEERKLILEVWVGRERESMERMEGYVQEEMQLIKSDDTPAVIDNGLEPRTNEFTCSQPHTALDDAMPG